MRVPVLGATALVASGVAVAIAIVQSLSSTTAQTQNRARYLPEYTASGDLILPKDFHEWVYVGSPLTPNALNGGMAGFPEFHNASSGVLRDIQANESVPRRDDHVQGAAIDAAGGEP
jgi:hypothetical protein